MVSIIVTHKKDTLYLKDCLESIAEQQFKDYETILVVDHTEDNIEPLIEEFKDKINLKVFYLEDKHGVSSARNLGLDKATGEYVYFLDNDDYLYGDSIKLLFTSLDIGATGKCSVFGNTVAAASLYEGNLSVMK